MTDSAEALRLDLDEGARREGLTTNMESISGLNAPLAAWRYVPHAVQTMPLCSVSDPQGPHGIRDRLLKCCSLGLAEGLH